MPDKEGSDDEKKSTKSVVNKRQKQMMGEEGYDIARDMGRVKPSKDKKDAKTMPPSKEMEKTRKVNKGPSALERVKKKYKGQIMKMEELDLTQVAKSFGGYIVESEIDDGFEDETEKKKKVNKAFSDAKSGKNLFQKKSKVTVGKGRDFKPPEKISKGEKLLAKAAGIDTSKLKRIKPPTEAQSVAMQAARDMQQSGQKLTKDVQKGMQDVATGKIKTVEPKPYTPRQRQARKYKLSPEKQAERVAKVKAKIDRENPTIIGKSGGKLPVPRPEPLPKDALKRTKVLVGRTAAKAKKQVSKVPKALVGAGKDTLKFAKKKPFSAAIVASTVVDALRGVPKIPKPPTPKGGKVVRRTAG